MINRIDIEEDDMFSIKSSFYEREDFEEVAQKMPQLLHLGRVGRKDLPFFEQLQNDTFQFFNNKLPILNDGVNEIVAPHHGIIRQMDGMEECQQLKNNTVHNTLASAVATRRLNKIVDALPADLKEAAHKHQCDQRDLQEQQDRVEQLRKLWQMKKAELDETGSTDTKELDRITRKGMDEADRLDNIEESADQSADKLSRLLDTEESGIRVALREGLSEAAADVQALNDAMSAFGAGCGDGTGMPVQIPESEAIKIAEKMIGNDKLRKIAEIAGRMQRIQEQAKKQKIDSVGGGIVGITSGGEINKLTSTELASFATPETELMMWQRVVEERAEIWRTEADENKGKGPIIVLQDGSGSTGGGIFDWESGMALTLRQECAARNQPFYWIHFDTRTQVKKFSPEGMELEAMEWAQTYMGGGTNPAQAMIASINVFADDEDFEDADVVLFSDGVFSPDESVCTEFRSVLNENNARCLGIYMGGKTGEQLENTTFGPICDVAWNFDYRAAEGDQEIEFLTELFTETTSGGGQ